MSNKNRNRQPITMTNTAQIQQQSNANGTQAPQEPNQQSQDDQANESTQDNAGADQAAQSSNDQTAEKAEDKAAPAPAQEKQAQPAAAPAPTKTQQQGFTPVYKVQLDLTNYAEHMAKDKTISPEEGGKWQYSLFTMIRGILNAKDQEEFNREWNTLLTFFQQNKDGIFNENFIHRFPHQWPGSTSEFTLHRRLITVILETADPKNRRKALNTINMELVTDGMNQAQRTRLLNFYEV